MPLSPEIMNCPQCGRPLSGERCEVCGPAAPPAAEASAPRFRKRPPLRKSSGPTYGSSWKLIAVSLLGAVVVTGFVLWGAASCADQRMKQGGNFDDEVIIPPGEDFAYIIVILLSSSYQFQVKPLDGQAFMAVGRVDDGDSQEMSESDLAGVMENAVAVEAGRTEFVTGWMTRGRYLDRVE